MSGLVGIVGIELEMVTLQDIADQVGVRKSVVSVALRGLRNTTPRVSEQMRERICKVAKELGYQPNAAARALTEKRTRTLGFVLSRDTVGQWANLYHAAILTGAETACRQRGYKLMITLSNMTEVETFAIPSKIGQRAVDGAILSGFVEEKVAKRFSECGIPCVAVGTNLEKPDLMPVVFSDVWNGRSIALRHAWERGHRRVWCYLDLKSSCVRKDAENWARQIGRELPGMHVELLEECQGEEAEAKHSLVRWFETPESQRPTLVAAADRLSVSLIREFRANGVLCPRDISVLALCDSDICKFCDPAITSIGYNSHASGEIAAGMLIDHLENGGAIEKSTLNACPCQLIVRDSISEVN